MQVRCAQFHGGIEMYISCRAGITSNRSSISQQRVARATAVIAGLFGILFFSNAAAGQGCVAAHSPQPLVAGLTTNVMDEAGHSGKGSRLEGMLHNLSVTIGFREYNSFRHYVGTVEQLRRAARHNQVQNHVDLMDLQISYRLSPRWSMMFDLPGLTATRQQQGNPNIFRSGGIGDITAGVQAWVFRPPTESHANIAFSVQLKMPTGINDAHGTTILANGTRQIRPFDESIQPGDHAWGFSLGTQAYRQIWFHTTAYFTGSWLFNPEDTTGVRTFRSAPHEDVISSTDMYLWRGGFSHGVPKVRGLALSLGGRMEGIPVRDAFGASNGFRRPGYVISLEPGLVYMYKQHTFNVSGPWALERNRTISTSDLLNGAHGDAAFSDYTIIASYTKRF